VTSLRKVKYCGAAAAAAGWGLSLYAGSDAISPLVFAAILVFVAGASAASAAASRERTLAEVVGVVEADLRKSYARVAQARQSASPAVGVEISWSCLTDDLDARTLGWRREIGLPRGREDISGGN